MTLVRDECNRPSTNPEDLSGLNPVIENGSITPGNASQLLTDGASACVVMDRKLAEQRGLQPMENIPWAFCRAWL